MRWDFVIIEALVALLFYYYADTARCQQPQMVAARSFYNGYLRVFFTHNSVGTPPPPPFPFQLFLVLVPSLIFVPSFLYLSLSIWIFWFQNLFRSHGFFWFSESFMPFRGVVKCATEKDRKTNYRYIYTQEWLRACLERWRQGRFLL